VLAVLGLLVVGIVVVGAMLIGQNRDSDSRSLPEQTDEALAPPIIEPPPVPVRAESTTTTVARDTVAQPPVAQARALIAASKFADAVTVLRKGLSDRAIPSAEARLARELLARAYARGGRAAEATRVYSEILKSTPGFTPNPRESNPAELAAFDAAKKLQVASARETTATTTPVAKGGDATFVVRAAPFASELLLDGDRKDSNKAQFRFTVRPGRHIITIRHPSLGNKVWTEEIAAGETRELSHDFLKSAGKISVSASGGWAEIYLDGQRTDRTTPAVLEGVLPGEHVVSLVSESFTVEGGPRTVQVKVGEQVNLQFRLKKK
jgi:hypothetical protein